MPFIGTVVSLYWGFRPFLRVELIFNNSNSFGVEDVLHDACSENRGAKPLTTPSKPFQNSGLAQNHQIRSFMPCNSRLRTQNLTPFDCISKHTANFLYDKFYYIEGMSSKLGEYRVINLRLLEILDGFI